MPNGIDFGTINVACEGYSGPGDPMVLFGSCVLRFTLEGHHDDVTTTTTTTTRSVYRNSGGETLLVLFLLFVVVV